MDRAAGFPGMSVSGNEKVHNAFVGLNAAWNGFWLLKQKLENGVTSFDDTDSEKLEEAQVWLSTRTGVNRGHAAEFAFDKIGVTQKLQMKWGANSLKMASFSSALGNGFDFAINTYYNWL